MTSRNRTIQGRLYELAEADPSRRSIGFYRSDRTCDWVDYGSLIDAAEKTAGSLAQLGLGQGEVAVLVPFNDRFAVETLLGTLVLGAIPLLVAPPVIQGTNSSLGDVLDDVIRRTDASVVVVGTGAAALSESLESRHPDVRFVFGPDQLPDPVPVRRHMPTEDERAMFQLTSGTTGFPRICVWRQRPVMDALEGMATAMSVGDDDVYLNWTPLYHDMGLMNNLMLCLTMGIPLVMMSPFDFVKRPALWLQAITDTASTITWSPNFGFALAADRIRDSELEGVDLSGVRGFWNAAERIHHDTIQQFEQRFTPFGLNPDSLKTNFGCAENVGGATFTDPDTGILVDHVDPVALHERQEAVLVDDPDGAITFVGCGRPHPGIKIHILDQDGRSLADGLVGELALDTVSAMEGYLDDEEATAAAFHGDLLKTGDLGYTRDGEFFWTGRSRERITVRGRKVDPSDLEAALASVPGLRTGSFVAFGLDDPALGTQRVVVIAEIREETAADAEEIRGAVRKSVFERLGLGLDDVVLVESGVLTKTSSGKRRHRHFRDLYQQGELSQFEVVS